jgi:hypothetical protein
MDRCQLCLKNEANQTGSHIIPFFLIKSLVNDDSKDKRDKEKSIRISTSDLISFYIGRNLSPEKIEKLLGRQLTEDEIDNNANHYTRDNVLCSWCEKRLQVIESEFNLKVYTKVQSSNRIQVRENLVFTDNLGINPEIIRLFFLSIIWRCSVTKFLNLNLVASIEEKLRELLDKGLTEKTEELVIAAGSIKDQLKQFSLGILHESNPDDSTRNICFIHQSNKAPYYFIFNEFIILFYYKRKSLYNPPDKCFGLENLRFKELINFKEDKFKIGILSKDQWNDFRINVVRHLVKIMSKRIEYLYTNLFERIRSLRPPRYLVNSVMREITGGSEDIIDNYSIRRIARIFQKYI